jgi:thiamine biosynthesis lipoprotein
LPGCYFAPGFFIWVTLIASVFFISKFMADIQLTQDHNHWLGSFPAMASNCEILIDSPDQTLATHITTLAQQETLRIQHKFSRYETNNILWNINHTQGQPLVVDEETAQLLDFADLCHKLSDGMFDITSGCLRRAWTFDGSDSIPTAEDIAKLLPLIGWQKITWKKPELQLPDGMELDFGGIGKEYAVDRVLQLLRSQTESPLLVNFGGDLAVTGPRLDGSPWQVGIETPDSDKQANKVLEISAGALATSGDSRRFLQHHGVRYSHILNPFNGWPIQQAPRSVTVAGSNCVQAGMLATFALLQGANAEDFLQSQDAIFWCLR